MNEETFKYPHTVFQSGTVEDLLLWGRQLADVITKNTEVSADTLRDGPCHAQRQDARQVGRDRREDDDARMQRRRRR